MPPSFSPLQNSIPIQNRDQIIGMNFNSQHLLPKQNTLNIPVKQHFDRPYLNNNVVQLNP